MGCLKNVTRALFLTVVIVGFMAFGGQDFIKNQFNNFVNPSHDVVLERAQKIGDFSKVNKEFEIEKAAGILGYNAVLAEHKATGQKMVVVDSGKKVILSAEDIKSPDAESRILAAINKIKYQSAAVEEFSCYRTRYNEILWQRSTLCKIPCKAEKTSYWRNFRDYFSCQR